MATEKELIEKAVAMLDLSYCPYSKFPVGAALECEDGAVFTGCNVENASYGLSNCAERTAAFKAVSEGHRKFKRIVIAGRCEDFCWPCGACRQVLNEFGPGMEVICLNAKGEAAHMTLPELIPHAVDSIWLGN
ncbi:MAG: cytidine deaminase [Ruminococcaceae bacterium]|jgi:cytidine deaminase|nr:cytidine deaminase [Oscillospiraceae bacterium]